MPPVDPTSLQIIMPASLSHLTQAAPRPADGGRTELSRGLDFTRPDPLGLAGHPALRGAAMRLLDGSIPAPFANPPGLTETEAQLARFCRMAEAITFASGCDAIGATLGHLLRPGDDVILDAGLPRAFGAAVHAARARPHLFPSGSVEAVERRLQRLSRQGRSGRLFLCVAAVSSLGSVIADLADLVPLAAAHGATLALDIGQDLGVMGRSGRGLAEVQARLGQCDLLLGSLTEVFGVTAGMVAARDPARLRGLRTASANRGLPPILAAALSAAVDLVQNDEIRDRRWRLQGSALRLRNHLMAAGLRLMGQPSHLVPIPLPPDRAPQMTALLASAGPVVPLVTAPQVGRHSPRWLVRLSSDHSVADIDNLADLIVDVTRVLRLRP